MIIIDGKKISNDIKDELKSEIANLKMSIGKVPGLVTILVGENPASKLYIASKAKACLKLGMLSKVEELPKDTTQAELIEVINFYNNNSNYHGILVQLPLPHHISEYTIIETINPLKDVDGFHPYNTGNLVIGKDTLFPCTPFGIIELLKRYNIETAGKHTVVIGRSNIVGKPIANLMLQKREFANSIVTICHSAAKDLSVYTKQADILIAAIGKPNYVTKEMIKNGAVIIDVGINRIIDENSESGYKVVGDVDFENIKDKVSYITPVPGGVGPMTIAMLLFNTVKAFKIIEGIK